MVHGDFRLGNLIVDQRGLAAVIDWELAHSGDPAEDLGWLCIRSWRFGQDEHPVAGVGSREQLLDAYEAAGGERPDPARLRYWELFGNLKWAAICARQAADHRSGLRRSHELASLGRRICEPEWDMLELIEAGGVTQDRPEAPELLDALAEYLFTDVRGAVPREERFRVLVAANLCAVLAREWRAGEEPLRRDLGLFAAILGEPPADPSGGAELEAAVRGAEARLVGRLRGGALDDRLDELARSLRQHVRRKLAIARPGYDG